MKILFLVVIFVLVSAKRKKSFAGDNDMSDCKDGITPSECTKQELNIRTLDGTCNNLRKPTLGAALTPLNRFLRAAYADKKSVPVGFPTAKKPDIPTPHEIAKLLFHDKKKHNGNAAGVSALHMTYGQFIDHDMSLSPHNDKAAHCLKPRCKLDSLEDFKYPCFPTLISKESDAGCQKFMRSFAVCDKPKKVRQQVNILSSFIDGSMIYGVEKEKLIRMRTNDDTGKMRVTNDKELLPFDPQSKNKCKTRGGCFLAGDKRVDEHIALVGFHTLFVREHNRLASELASLNKLWGGERIFQTARKIVGALIQHITYNEYVPTLAKLKKYKGYDRFTNPSIANAFSTAAFRFGHSQIANSWSQLDKNFNQLKPNIPLRQTFFNNTVLIDDGIESTFYGLIGNQSETVDTTFAFGVSKKLFIPPGKKGFANLAAINIQRGRDHGLPSYNKWRKFCGLKKAKSFVDYKKEIQNKEDITALRKLYKRVNNYVDLFPAALAEKHLHGRQVGPTFSCIIKKQFENLRDGDRFFYKRRGVFTKAQLKEFQKVTLAKVLCDNLHGIVSIQKDVFKAFKEGTKRNECHGLSSMNLKAWRE